MRTRLANTLWAASCRPEWGRFRRAAGRVRESQAALLAGILAANRETRYGREYGFDRIDSPADFQRRVPITDYDDYVEPIAAIAAGEPAVLTAEPVRMFERSSGSTAASKLVPYTAGLKADFQRGIAPWIYDLYTRIPALRRGPAYWSITPLTDGPQRTAGGIPIGFESDSDYLGALGQRLSGAVMAVPDAVKRVSDIDAFRYVTLLELLRRPDLRLISVWNPTYLELLLAPLPNWWNSLLQDLAGGTVSRGPVEFAAEGSPHLAERFSTADPARPITIWPDLALISCWADGASAAYVPRIETLFPGVPIQGKGLLATEAFVSLPLVRQEGSLLAVRSHFFEFQADDGSIRLADELDAGQVYSVIVTTSGGLYRYELFDRIEVLGFWRQVPRIRFLGKAGHVSDWFGEKLEAGFVQQALAAWQAAQGLEAGFAFLAPETEGGFRYVLYIEAGPLSSAAATDLDARLRNNFHYDYCRRLGQIGMVELRSVRNGPAGYLAGCRARGQKLGNIKPTVLEKTAGWGEFLE